MSTNPLNNISQVYLEQIASPQLDERVRPGNVEKPLDKAAFKKRRRSLAGKEKSAEARSRGHVGKEWYNSGRTYSPDEAKRGRANMPDHERQTRHRSAVDPDNDNDDMYSADKTKNPKKIRKQKAMGELGESSHLELDMKKRREANEKAVEDMKKTKSHKDMVAAVRKKFDEALDPVGHEDADVDNDGKKNTNADKYLVKRRKAIGKAISTQEAKEVKRWWDDDGDGKGYEEGEVSGKFKKKKVKESFSNWRQDLSEVIKNAEIDKKITEKSINNKIEINPKLDLGEAIGELGGTLLEMVEIDEFDFILESAYDELLEEGYEEDDIEEALEYALTEATVTFGHDTPTGQKKKGNLLKAVGRLARQKLSSKVRGAKKSTQAAVARGARKVAKGALGVARKMEGGDKKPHAAERKPSTYRGAGAGTKEKVSSGSYTPPAKKKAEKPADPWKGSSTVPQKPKPKPKAEKPSDPWEGSATTPSKAKPKAATKKAAAPKAKAPAATKRKRKSKLDDLLASVRSESVIGNRARNAVADDRLDAEQERTNASMNKLRQQNKRFDRALASDAARKVERDVKKSSAYGPQRPKPGTVTGRRIEDPKPTGSKATGYRVEELQINEMPYQVMGSPDGGKEKKIGKPVKSKKYADARAAELADTHKATGGKYRSQYVEGVQIDEKTLTKMEMKKREEIVKSMKDKASDFEKRYPGRGKEVMYATATKMAKRMAEQALELQSKTQPVKQEDPKAKVSAQRAKSAEINILQRRLQAIRQTPAGTPVSGIGG